MRANGRRSARIALFLPSLGGGGAERVFVDLANAFAVAGHRVDLVLALAEGPYLPEVSSSVRVVDLRAGRVTRALPRLVRYLHKERPEAMLSALDHANIIAIGARMLARSPTRCVVSVRAMPSAFYRIAGAGKRRIVGRLMKYVYGFADTIVANSEAVAVDLSHYLRVGTGRLRVIHNPLNLKWIEQQAQLGVDHAWAESGIPIVLGVGSLNAYKDFGTLLRAFAGVRARGPCRLVIIGEGPQRAQLERMSGELGIAADVLMPGFNPNPFAWMRHAAAFVSSSVTEGCPNAMLQALACGTPVVSTDCPGGSAEVLEGGRWGRLVPVGDSKTMADAIAATLTAEVQPDVRRRALDFAIEPVSARYLEIMLPHG